MAKKRPPLWHEFGIGAGQTVCGLCGNGGVIDTRGVKSPTGRKVGGVWWCVCPNGRALRRVYRGQPVPESAYPDPA